MKKTMGNRYTRTPDDTKPSIATQIRFGGGGVADNGRSKMNISVLSIPSYRDDSRGGPERDVIRAAMYYAIMNCARVTRDNALILNY